MRPVHSKVVEHSDIYIMVTYLTLIYFTLLYFTLSFFLYREVLRGDEVGVFGPYEWLSNVYLIIREYLYNSIYLSFPGSSS